MQRIVFINDEGGASVVVPTDEWLARLGIEGIAATAVPPVRELVGDGTFCSYEDPENPNSGAHENLVWEERQRPYKVVNASDIPEDREERNVWAKGLFE